MKSNSVRYFMARRKFRNNVRPVRCRVERKRINF